MHSTKPMNPRTLLTLLWLSALLGLLSSSVYAFSDADFAANAVRTPAVEPVQDRYRSSYSDRYTDYSAARQREFEARQQKQRAEEEQKYNDAQFSSVPRANESDAEYQARMAREKNPVWLKHQAQVKLQTQIQDQQEAKLKQQSVSTGSNNSAPTAGNSIASNTLNSSGLSENQIPSAVNNVQSLSANPQTPELSSDSIPREMSMAKYIGYSLFYLVSIVGSLIFSIAFLRHRH